MPRQASQANPHSHPQPDPHPYPHAEPQAVQIWEFQRLDSQRLTWKRGVNGDKVMKNISILQIKSACQRGNPKTYFLTLVEGRRTRRWPFAFPTSLSYHRWLAFVLAAWRISIWDSGPGPKFMQIHFKFPDATATALSSDLRPPTCNLGPSWWWWWWWCRWWRRCTCAHTYIYTCWPADLAWLSARMKDAGCRTQDAVVVRKCRHLYYYNYYVDVHGFTLWRLLHVCLPVCGRQSVSVSVSVLRSCSSTLSPTWRIHNCKWSSILLSLNVAYGF